MITFVSFKGGAGKSTALMSVASVLVERGNRVAVLDADDNKPMLRWRKYADDLETWDDRCEVIEVRDFDAFEEVYQKIAAENFGYILMDTRGGGSDFNQAIVHNANLIVVPTALSIMELDEAFSTLEWAGNLLKTTKSDVPVGILLNRTPTAERELSTVQRKGLAALSNMPVFENRLPTRKAFEDLKAYGMIYPYIRHLEANPVRKVMANHVKVALAEAEQLTDEMLEVLAVPVAA